MILFGAVAAVLIVFWLRVRFYRVRFNRALKTMQRGGIAQRASVTFWKIVGIAVLVMVVRVYLDMHHR